MPFTPAHVVAAVPLSPLLGARGVVSALAIGAMAPDLAYFVHLGVARWESHSIGGIFWFCLPLGLAVWVLFQTCIAPMLHDCAPEAARARLPAAWSTGRLPSARLFDAALCIVIGSFTHLVWDSFTHGGTPLARAFPALVQTMMRIDSYAIRPVTVLQNASTLLGFALLTAWARRWWTESAPAATRPAPPIALRCLIVALVLGPAIWLGGEAAITRFGRPDEPLLKLQQAAKGIVFTGGTIFLWSLVGAALVWRLVRALPSVHGPPPEPLEADRSRAA